ncbi:hypothetical protein C7212DRAFT_344793 [Tuber magnatum]|uniref:Uncharacterized protein n=1 Tax=Tuber magnatum TaxID=42249 RepID=A0A317SPQ8_9PEZI|nr:hypothetical protein C7212DRAFT_344793 [Tuber magnatum]
MSHVATRDLLAKICTTAAFAHFISVLCDIYLHLPITAPEVELIRSTLAQLQVCQARIIYSRPTEHLVYVSEWMILGALHEGLLTLAREVDRAIAQEEGLLRGVGGELSQSPQSVSSSCRKIKERNGNVIGDSGSTERFAAATKNPRSIYHNMLRAFDAGHNA